MEWIVKISVNHDGSKLLNTREGIASVQMTYLNLATDHLVRNHKFTCAEQLVTRCQLDKVDPGRQRHIDFHRMLAG